MLTLLLIALLALVAFLLFPFALIVWVYIRSQSPAARAAFDAAEAKWEREQRQIEAECKGELW